MKIKSRKEVRKELRKAKKLKRHEFFTKKRLNNFSKNKKNNSKPEPNKCKPKNDVPSKGEQVGKEKEKKKKGFENPLDEKDYQRTKEKKQRQNLEREIKRQRVKQLKMDNMKEDIEIKKLEKQLKMKKGKSKAFAVDGLDYLLDICNKKIAENDLEKTFNESDSEFESDFENIVGETKSDKKKKLKEKDEKMSESDYGENEDEDLNDYSESNLSDSDIGEGSKTNAKNNKKRKMEDKKKKTGSKKVKFEDEEDEEEAEDIDFDDDDDDIYEEDEEEENSEMDLKSKNKKEKRKEKKNIKVRSKKEDEIDEEDNSEIESLSKQKTKSIKKAQKGEKKGEALKEKDKKKKDNKKNKKEKNIKETKKFQRSDIDDDDEEFDDDIDEDDWEDDDEFIDDEDEGEHSGENKEEVKKMWEDIYGRTRDEMGNVVKTYTPPHLRKMGGEGGDNEKLSEKLVRLKKQLKGLLNRLAETNMAFIANQIEQLYMSNSRNDMNETICNLFKDSLFSEVLTPERLITEHAMLIAVLHSNIGSEIGSHFLQFSVTEFCRLLESNLSVEDKKINNILIFVMHLYNFQIFHSKLMYDIINELLKNLEEKQIELLLLTLRTVGFNLRKDDPVALKSLVIKVQEQANSISTGENSSRVKFMLEMLMAIKNNNMSKIPNYNPELVERLRKNFKVLVRKGNYCTELNISLQDLLNAEEHGRWWIVGSAWSGTAPTQPDSSKTQEVPVSTEFSQKLLDLARKQRMNTDVRRNIFCILMSAEDFLEAFEKLLRLKLKGAVEREIMNVLLHCALQEKNFNPYYFYLANKFCTFDRKYQMMLQCAVWDKIKEIKNYLPVQVTNLAKFVGNVILEKGLPISVLKVIEFSDLDKPTIKFMRQVLLSILIHEDRNSVAAVFRRIADSPKLKLFRESLRLFLQHFVLKNTKNIAEEKVSKLVEMVKVAEQALESTDVKIIF